MTIKSLITAALLFACASAFAYRDAIGQQTFSCNATNGCYDGVPVPCSSGSGTCVYFVPAGAQPPGGAQPCTDGSASQYYSASPPPGWSDCISPNGLVTYPYCPRTSNVCETVNFYKDKNSCATNAICSFNKVYACAYGSPPVPPGGTPAPAGQACPGGPSPP